MVTAYRGGILEAPAVETLAELREALGETPIIIGCGETVLGYITLADTIRETRSQRSDYRPPSCRRGSEIL
jgi:cation transport ATPase